MSATRLTMTDPKDKGAWPVETIIGTLNVQNVRNGPHAAPPNKCGFWEGTLAGSMTEKVELRDASLPPQAELVEQTTIASILRRMTGDNGERPAVSILGIVEGSNRLRAGLHRAFVGTPFVAETTRTVTELPWNEDCSILVYDARAWRRDTFTDTTFVYKTPSNDLRMRILSSWLLHSLASPGNSLVFTPVHLPYAAPLVVRGVPVPGCVDAHGDAVVLYEPHGGQHAIGPAVIAISKAHLYLCMAAWGTIASLDLADTASPANAAAIARLPHTISTLFGGDFNCDLHTHAKRVTSAIVGDSCDPFVPLDPTAISHWCENDRAGPVLFDGNFYRSSRDAKFEPVASTDPTDVALLAFIRARSLIVNPNP